MISEADLIFISIINDPIAIYICNLLNQTGDDYLGDWAMQFALV